VEIHNPNCDGSHCRSEAGEVRTYPLGGGANLILCMSCWAHENRYRFERGAETQRTEDWPQLNWNAASVYESA
jgi:hypothetical protein